MEKNKLDKNEEPILDSLIEDMGDLGITKPEMNIRYGVGKRSAFIKIDEELVQDFIISGGSKIRRVEGEAFMSSVDLNVLTSDEDKIKFRFIFENVRPVATHIEFYYTKKGGEDKISLINPVNSLTMNSYFSRYMEGKYSPLELFYVCIHLTPLGKSTDPEFVIRDNISEPSINGRIPGDEEDKEEGEDDLPFFIAKAPTKSKCKPLGDYEEYLKKYPQESYKWI